MNSKYLIILLLFLVPVTIAVHIEPPVDFIGDTTNIIFNYATDADIIDFYASNDTLIIDDITHAFTCTGVMDIYLNSYLEILHTGDSGTWTVSGLSNNSTYAVYVDGSFSEIINSSQSITLDEEAVYEIVATPSIVYEYTLWEPLNETCAKLTIHAIYEPWYPELNYTVANQTYYMYKDSTGTLIATNTTTNTNDTIKMITDGLLSVGNYTIRHYDTASFVNTTPVISSVYPTTTPVYSIVPQDSYTQRVFTIRTDEADINLKVDWYYGQEYQEEFSEREDYLDFYGYTYLSTDMMVTNEVMQTFTATEEDTVGIIARLYNSTTGLYVDQAWNWVPQYSDFTESMKYQDIPTGSSNEITLETSNEHISSVVLQYELNDTYYNVTMNSIYSNDETEYKEIFKGTITPSVEGTYNLVQYFVVQDGIENIIPSGLAFRVQDNGGTIQYTGGSSKYSSSGSGRGNAEVIIEKLAVSDGSERFKKTDIHALYSVSSSIRSYVITIKDDNTKIDGNIYKQIDISSSIKTPTQYEITFLVDNDWLASNNGTVMLMHYENDAWKEVPVTIIAKTNEFVKFKSTITSFSPYAIISVEDKTVVDEVFDTVVNTVNKTTTKSNYSTWTYIGIALLVVLLIKFTSKNRKKFKPKNKKSKKIKYEEF